MQTKKNLLLLFLFSSVTLFSQKLIPLDSIKAVYDREAIYYKSSNYIKGNQKFPIGIFQEKLLTEFSKSEEGKTEVQKHKKLKLISGSLLLLTVTGIGYSIVFNPALALVFLIPDFAALYFELKALEHLEKARWLYNRDIVIAKLAR